MNQEEFEHIIRYSVENGIHPSVCPENIANFIYMEVDSLHTLKIKLETQRFAINNLLSIIDRCESFGIINEVLDEVIQCPNSSIPGSETDYTHFLEKMVKAIAKKKYNIYTNFSNIEGIDIEEVVAEFQEEYGYANLRDVCVEEVDDLGCNNTLNCERISESL